MFCSRDPALVMRESLGSNFTLIAVWIAGKSCRAEGDAWRDSKCPAPLPGASVSPTFCCRASGGKLKVHNRGVKTHTRRISVCVRCDTEVVGFGAELMWQQSHRGYPDPCVGLPGAGNRPLSTSTALCVLLRQSVPAVWGSQSLLPWENNGNYRMKRQEKWVTS